MKYKKYQFSLSEEFDNQLTSVAYRAGLSRIEAIMAGIDLLERLVEADSQDKEIAFVEKTQIDFPGSLQDLG
jgi:hypothetical protein